MTVRIGTRRSLLALWQAEHVRDLLAAQATESSLVPIVTKGDKIQDVALTKVGGKGLFLKEIEEALVDGRVDLAVHSLKDVPAEVPDGLIMVGYLSRSDPRDAFISRTGTPFADLPAGARIGTGSLRRAVQLIKIRPDITLSPIRGNVQTRLRKLEEENLDGIVLAAAGLKRLELQERITHTFPVTDLIPAVGQGILGLECRADDDAIIKVVKGLLDPETMRMATAERLFLKGLQGSCQVPMGAHCYREESGDYRILAFVASPDGTFYTREDRSGEEPAVLAESIVQSVLERGAGEVITHADDYPHPF